MSDTYRPPSARVLRWVAAALGSNAKVLATVRLVGGLTADMDRLTVSVGGVEFDVVLRRWSDTGPASGLIDRETAGLTLLAGRGVPAPRLLAADRTGTSTGTPSLLMTALPGEPWLQPRRVAECLRPLAQTLVRIHDLTPTGLADTDPHGIRDRAEPGWITDPALARDLVDVLSTPLPALPHVLVHSDYQQFNVLWRGRDLTGVVDWPFTGGGPREIDVGHCRLALAVLFSAEIADEFLRHYEAESGVRVDPYADIRAVLSFGPSWLEFVPKQVAGRAPVDPPGMPARVEAVLRAAVKRLG